MCVCVKGLPVTYYEGPQCKSTIKIPALTALPTIVLSAIFNVLIFFSAPFSLIEQLHIHGSYSMAI